MSFEDLMYTDETTKQIETHRSNILLKFTFGEGSAFEDAQICTSSMEK